MKIMVYIIISEKRVTILYLFLASGSVYVWGSGADGQLGLGDKVLFITSPKRLKDSSLHRKVTYISSGECYSAAITGMVCLQRGEGRGTVMNT